MPVTPKDLVKIKISPAMSSTAQYLADKRMLFEFPRGGYGSYNASHVAFIESGIIGELAVLEYLHNFLSVNYGSLSPAERVSLLHKQVKFSYMLVIGSYDGGYEFSVGSKPSLIDVKTYHQQKVSDSQIFNGLKNNPAKPSPLNLFIDATQSHKADIYIQTFLSLNNEIIIAGYCIGLPPIQNWMPNKAHTKAVPDLEPIRNLPSFLKL